MVALVEYAKTDARHRLNLAKYIKDKNGLVKVTRLSNGAIIVDPVNTIETASQSHLLSNPNVKRIIKDIDAGRLDDEVPAPADLFL